MHHLLLVPNPTISNDTKQRKEKVLRFRFEPLGVIYYFSAERKTAYKLDP